MVRREKLSARRYERLNFDAIPIVCVPCNRKLTSRNIDGRRANFIFARSFVIARLNLLSAAIARLISTKYDVVALRFPSYVFRNSLSLSVKFLPSDSTGTTFRASPSFRGVNIRLRCSVDFSSRISRFAPRTAVSPIRRNFRQQRTVPNVSTQQLPAIIFLSSNRPRVSSTYNSPINIYAYAYARALSADSSFARTAKWFDLFPTSVRFSFSISEPKGCTVPAQRARRTDPDVRDLR